MIPLPLRFFFSLLHYIYIRWYEKFLKVKNIWKNLDSLKWISAYNAIPREPHLPSKKAVLTYNTWFIKLVEWPLDSATIHYFLVSTNLRTECVKISWDSGHASASCTRFSATTFVTLKTLRKSEDRVLTKPGLVMLLFCYLIRMLAGKKYDFNEGVDRHNLRVVWTVWESVLYINFNYALEWMF